MGIEALTKTDKGILNAPSTAASWVSWIAATDQRSYALEDPLLDWLDLFGTSAGFQPDTQIATFDERTNHALFIMRRSQLFEEAVISHLKKTVGVTMITHRPDEARDIERALATIQAMIDGNEVIHRGVLWDAEHQAYGVPDLLVRSDVLPNLFNALPDDYQPMIKAPGIGASDYHYVVVDIKFKRLPLNAPGDQVSNSVDQLPDKAQVCVYNRALGRIQEYLPERAYLLGRGWERTQRGTKYASEDSFDLLGPVNTNDAKLIQLVDAATLWIRDLRVNGSGWQLQPMPTRRELYPNMNNESDFPWHHAKSVLADDLRELTALWMVRVTGRNGALANGLKSWNDPACNAPAVGVTGPAQSPKLEKIIRINQTTVDPAVSPKSIGAQRAVWHPQPPLEFYVDFEWVSDLADDFSIFPVRGGQPMIFMIGCGHIENGTWQFKCFVADRLTEDYEAFIIDQWYSHMSEIKARLVPAGPEPYVIHWYRAEPGFLELDADSAFNRHTGHRWTPVNWFDFLANVVEVEPVVVRGSLGFSLKPFAKALKSHGLIGTDWGDGPSDGLGAMVGAWWCDAEAARTGKRIVDVELMDGITAYNEVDCKVMEEIVRYLRVNH